MTLRREASQSLPVDEIYARLIALGAGKSDRDARKAVAALVLLLINHVGDERVVMEALDIVDSLAEGAPTLQVLP